MKFLTALLLLVTVLVPSICCINNKHVHGEALNIVKFGDTNNSVIIDHDALSRLLLHPEVKNRKIVMMSIVGAFRKGKSFFLDYCLRFMYGNVSSFKICGNVKIDSG